jgi:putative oxidoreductase
MVDGILPASWQGFTHAALRIMTGLLFLEHGTAKILKFPNIDEILRATAMPSGMVLGTGLVELVGGALILIGFFTRTVSFILSGYMAVAYFMAHAPMSFFPILNFGESAILYCFIFLWLATAGGGPFSLSANRRA